MVPDVQRTLVFFDDHQAGIRRLEEARQAGFRHYVSDDNYFPGVGDNFALKQICAGWPLWEFLHKPHPIYLDNFAQSRTTITMEAYEEHVRNFQAWTSVYAEFPPVWDGPTRFALSDEICSTPGGSLVYPRAFGRLGYQRDDSLEGRVGRERLVNIPFPSTSKLLPES